MADTQETTKKQVSDYPEVLHDISEELLARLTMEADGAIIDMFQTGSFDPWQLFIFFGALEKALVNFRTDKRCKTVYVHVQPESLAGIGRVVTPLTAMLEHVCMERLEDVGEGRLELGNMLYNGEQIEYQGVDLKGRHVVLISDLLDVDSSYLKECIDLCHDMKASHVVAVPMMVWNPKVIDHLDAETVKKEFAKQDKNPVS